MATFFLAPTTDKRMSCLVRTYKNQKNQYYLIQYYVLQIWKYSLRVERYGLRNNIFFEHNKIVWYIHIFKYVLMTGFNKR